MAELLLLPYELLLYYIAFNSDYFSNFISQHDRSNHQNW